MRKKSRLNCEIIWKIRKKSKLNIEMIWKMWKKGKLKSGKIWKIKWWQNFVRNVIIEINNVITKKNWRGRVETSARDSSQ